jgi:hypothetical protein
VGAYQLAPNANFVITMEGNQLISRLTGQPNLPLFAQSETMFFAKAVDAQTEFSGSDDQGRATTLTLHQNGRDMPAQRLSDAEAKPILDFDASIVKRFKDQTAAPGSQAAVRRTIEELRTGQPNYDLMSAQFANVTRQQLTGLQANIVKLGALQTLTFKGVGPAGADIYELKFENGSMEFRIGLGADGKTLSAGMRPL